MRFIKSKLGAMLAAAVAWIWFCPGAGADTVTFAMYPDGTQVPASNVSTTIFNPTSVVGDQFAALGIHFHDTGLLTEVTGLSDGGSTHADGWCPSGGYTCSPNNILLENSPSGGQSLDTLKITFDVPQIDVLGAPRHRDGRTGADQSPIPTQNLTYLLRRAFPDPFIHRRTVRRCSRVIFARQCIVFELTRQRGFQAVSVRIEFILRS
jgi:hypothetical protein